MKNTWIKKWKIKHENDYVLDFNSIIGDTLKEKFEGVYVFLINIYRSQEGFRVVTSPECAALMDTGCCGFSPPTQEDIDAFSLGKMYRLRGGPSSALNLWVDPAMSEPVYKIHAVNQKNGAVVNTIKVYLDNYVI